jgi:hypothetical protein
MTAAGLDPEFDAGRTQQMTGLDEPATTPGATFTAWP